MDPTLSILLQTIICFLFICIFISTLALIQFFIERQSLDRIQIEAFLFFFFFLDKAFL